MKQLLKKGGVLCVAVLVVYYFRAPLGDLFAQLRNALRPCSVPIAYDIGSFDERFGIRRADFLAALQRAEEIWENPTKRDLFRFVEGGGLKINLIYDTRQQTTQQLQKIDSTVDAARAHYDELGIRYKALLGQYQIQKAAFEAKLASFNQRQEAYSAEVERWNKRGGAPKNTYEQLQMQQSSFREEAAALEAEQNALSLKAEQVNTLVVELNSLAERLNLNVEKYNTLGASLGEEFTEGVYRSGAGKREIDIYQYDNQAKLVRVLAHELGHALGLGHVEDKKAIMYRLNAGINERLTATDIAAVSAHCALQ